VEKGKGGFAFNIISDGSGAERLIIPAGGCRRPADEDSGMVTVRSDGNMRSDEDLFMNGLEVMNFSVREVPRAINMLLERTDREKSDVALFGFHQANKFMIEYLTKILKIPKEAVPIAMAETGNTSAASIPLMLSLEHPRLAEENRLGKSILCGFGVGLSCAAVSLDLSDAAIFPPVELS